QLAAEESLRIATARIRQRLGHMISIGLRLQQLPSTSLKMGGQLLEQNSDRLVVAHQMMRAHDRMPSGPVASSSRLHLQQRRSLQIQPLVLRAQPLFELL